MQLRKYLGMSIDDMLGLPPLPSRAVPVSEIQSAVQQAMDNAIERLRRADNDAPPERKSPFTPKRKKPE